MSEPGGGSERATVELHPVRLLRAAQGDRPLEAAIILLANAELLNTLHCCVIVDVERNLAWLDWSAALQIAERLDTHQRALVRLAAVLAQDMETAITAHRRPVELALRHLRI